MKHLEENVGNKSWPCNGNEFLDMTPNNNNKKMNRTPSKF